MMPSNSHNNADGNVLTTSTDEAIVAETLFNIIELVLSDYDSMKTRSSMKNLTVTMRQHFCQ
jgi:hypothetical protein